MQTIATRSSLLAIALLAACASGPKTYWDGTEPVQPESTTTTTTTDGTPAPEPQTAPGRNDPPPPQQLVGRVVLGTPTFAASYADATTKTLTPVVRDMEVCYQTELALDATLAGTVKVAFTVSGEGVVTAWQATGVEENVANCIGSVIEGLKFPPPPGKRPIKGTYPFKLSPG